MSIFSNDHLETIEAIAPNKDFLRELVVIVGDASTYREQDEQRLKPAKTERTLQNFARAVRKSHDALHAQWQKLENEDKELSEEIAELFDDLLDEWRPSSLNLIADSIEMFAEHVGDSNTKGGPSKKYASIRLARRLAVVFERHSLKVVSTPESDFIVTLDCVLRAGDIEGNARNLAEKLVPLLRNPP